MAITAINLLVGLHTRTSLRVIPRKFYMCRSVTWYWGLGTGYWVLGTVLIRTVERIHNVSADLFIRLLEH